MHTIKRIANKILAFLAIILLILSTTLFFIPILLLGLLKLIPITPWQIFCTHLIDKVINGWVEVNNLYVNHLRKTTLHIKGLQTLNKKDWYLVIANHQSWLDIVILQRLFNRHIPMLKFFIKDQLKWVPLLGFAWWAMGCPFMKRYSREYLTKYPHKKGEDLTSTRKALNLFQHLPSTVMNFIEGTRFTSEKQLQQKSPYTNLLKPKAGGIGFVITTIGDKITSLLDVTLVYPHHNPTLWDYLCGNINEVFITIREIPIPKEFVEDMENQQSNFHNWLNQMWLEKDLLITHQKNAFK